MAYKSKLTVLETLRAMEIASKKFEDELTSKLNLLRVSCPLFVDAEADMSDDPDEPERGVTFNLKCGKTAQVLPTSHKWKHVALKKYHLESYSGIYVNMMCIRKDEDLDPLHSYLVDHCAWEIVIKEEDRRLEHLQAVVKDIYECMRHTEDNLIELYPNLRRKLPEAIHFISAQELEDAYPQLSPEERETKYTEKYKAVFVAQIGGPLKSGNIHTKRRPDCDDMNLNGDILVYHPDLNIALELSSMGIRNTKESMMRQLTAFGKLGALDRPYRKAVLNCELPLCMGGGIGQSRLLMFLLDKIHIGEVQCSIWDEKTLTECAKNNISLM